MIKKMELRNPLFADWQEQHVKLAVPGVAVGQPLELSINGASADFQFTGETRSDGAEVLLRIGLAKGETKVLEFTPAPRSRTDLAPREIPLAAGARIGVKGRELAIPAADISAPSSTVAPQSLLSGPFAAFAGFPFQSRVYCESPFESASLHQVNDGPLFTDYELQYRFADHRRYTLRFRCFKQDPYIEVREVFSLGMNADLVWTLNPGKRFTHIISRDSFEGDNQPTVEPLGAAHPRDVLCRLQMPVLTEYFIPNNRGWFAFCDSRNEAAGMLGLLGLYGAQWQEPVINMPELFDRGGTVEWHSSLASGTRYWLLYAGPVEKGYTPERRFVFHRLHAEFNALRLDEHLDLAGTNGLERSGQPPPGFFGTGDYHARARQRVDAFSSLQHVLPEPDRWMQANGSLHLTGYRYLLEPSDANGRALYDLLIVRFERWVRQFQGWRTGENDYMKNVIGFSRYLRGMLLGYEMLRSDGRLTDEQLRKLSAYFAFAARRILDEGRWPHSKTWKHPDHPESVRDFYTYGGEHRPDRLVWTNSLPNFQSDPMCALAHLSAVFRDRPEASGWRRFALDDIDRQLDAYGGDSGAWEESINYALYTFSYLVITFKALKASCAIDYFQDKRVRRFADWLVRYLGPKDKRWDKYTWPGVGNASCPTAGGEYLLCYAGELAVDDPLRADCLAVWQRLEANCRPSEHYPVVMATMAPIPDRDYPLRPLHSELMDEVGVAMRHAHPQANQSYLFQKIGFAKDHYEADETAFNWYAKGTPLCMDYGTYTGDAAIGAAHNAVEIPDEDSLRRGYLANHLFTPAVDFTHCEVPVSLKLLWGRVRSFAEVENKDGKIDRNATPYFYIGDKNPMGPKCWKVRMLLFVKPDYVVLFDRVYGEVPHRYNLHVTATDIRRQGPVITAKGRFDLDPLVFVQHPTEFEMETGELVPGSDRYGKKADNPHRQDFFRLYNHQDGIYRTLVFAGERGRTVRIESVGDSGMKVIAPDYTDYVFLHNDVVDLTAGDVRFVGRVGWVRRDASGRVQAIVPDGESISAFGVTIAGRGPWIYNADGAEHVELCGGPPRPVVVTPSK